MQHSHTAFVCGWLDGVNVRRCPAPNTAIAPLTLKRPFAASHRGLQLLQEDFQCVCVFALARARHREQQSALGCFQTMCPLNKIS